MAAKKGKRRPTKRATTKRATTRRAATKPDVVEFGHKVWLAGLGAFARARTEGPKLFDTLVEEGASVHEQARDATQRSLTKLMTEIRGATDQRIAALRGTADETWDNVEKIFQARVHKALQQLGMPTSQEIRALTRKVDDLAKGVETLGKRERRNARTVHSSAGGHSAVV